MSDYEYIPTWDYQDQPEPVYTFPRCFKCEIGILHHWHDSGKANDQP